MNIFLKIFNLFKKNTINSQKVEMVSLNSKFVMPRRSDYKDREDIQKLIEYYKKEYLEILSSKKTITSSELDLGTYYDEIKMYIELLNRICMKEDYSDNERQLIDATKLTIYKYKIFELEIRTKARLIALDEIKHSPKILFRNRNAINEEIEHLKNNTIIAQSNRMAAENEINAYRIRRNIDNIEINDEKLKEKYKELCTLADGITNASHKKEEPLVTKTAKLEVALEKYAFLNKEELHQMEIQLNELEKEKKCIENRSDLLKRIEVIQNKYLVFLRYGDKSVNKEKIKRLFSIKFDIITTGCLSGDCFYENYIKENSNEIEYYKQVILDKITLINMGKNDYIKEMFGTDSIKAANLIINTIRFFNVDLNTDELLKNDFVIRLIKSFDTNDGFDILLESNYNNTRSKSFSKELVFNDRIIKTYIQMSDYCRLLIVDMHFENEAYEKLCNLRIKRMSESDYFYIPVGVREINAVYEEPIIPDYRSDDLYEETTVKPKYTKSEKHRLKVLHTYAANKIVVLPWTLESLDYQVFGDFTPKAIVLHNSEQKILNYNGPLYFMDENKDLMSAGINNHGINADAVITIHQL